MFINCKYKKCCCQNNYDNKLIEDVCDNVGTMPTYEIMNSNECKCGFDEGINAFPENPMLAQSYVPFQIMDKTFTPCVGLKMGTIFPELVSPYEPNQSVREIEYIEQTNTIKEGCNKC